jgi:hypothetical protein
MEMTKYKVELLVHMVEKEPDKTNYSIDIEILTLQIMKAFNDATLLCTKVEVTKLNN